MRPALVADAAVPGRDRLLDPAWVAQELGRVFPNHAVEDVELVRAKYRIGESLRVVYRYRSEGGIRTVTARTFPQRRSASVAAAARLSVRVGADAGRHPAGEVERHPGSWVALHAAVDAVWWRLPHDRKLVGLAELVAPTPATAERMGLQGWTRSTVVEYAPERSITIRADDDAGTSLAFVKCYAPSSVDIARLGARYHALARHLEPVSGVASPKLLHADDRRNLLVLEAMDGEHWGGGSSAVSADLLRLGRAVAHVHALDAEPAELGLRTFARLATARLQRSATLVAAAVPHHGAEALSLAERLADGRPRAQRSVVLHGDCHPGNALMASAHVALLDLDQAGVGDPAVDLGSLVARVRYGGLVGEFTRADAVAMEESALHGYADVAPLPDPDSLRWHVAAALLAERSIRSVNRLNPVGLEHLGEVLAAGHAALDEVGR